MPIDPAAGYAQDTAGRTAERLADLERRVRQLENAPTASVGTATPTQNAAEGAVYGQSDGTPRLWLRVAGAWRFVNLT